jgi:putative transposase
MNRGNDRRQVFHDAQDYGQFVALIEQSCRRLPVPVLSYCLMPNHFHLVLWPRGDGDLGRWMQWLLTAHVRRYRKRHGGSGHVWQGRFKAFPAQSDVHLHTVMRYVERNPLRSGLVPRAEAWAWSSLSQWGGTDRPFFLCEGPLPRPQPWVDYVNLPQTKEELALLERSILRGAPLGELQWVRDTARRLGLEYTLNPRGRPSRQKKESEK